MFDLMTKYFQGTTDNQSTFKPPATDEQITNLESQLKIQLPNDYKMFLKSTNGFEGFINNFFVDLAPIDQVYQITKDTCAEPFPWAIYIGTNSNLEMFVINKLQKPIQFGLLPFIGTDNDFIKLGNTFEELIIRLYNDTAFDSV